MRDLSEIFDRLRTAEEGNPIPELKTRISWLEKLRSAVLSRRADIRTAVWEDFRKSPVEADLTESIPVLLELRTALRNLASWTAPKRLRSAFPLWGMSSRLQHNPKGVVLILSPWNYPFNLSLGPLVSALAAGNRVIVKPSERVPHSSRLIASLIGDALPEDVATVVEGGVEVGAELLNLPFDHFYFTGGAAVGKEVMHAAARHLCSVTLELGGKSPAVVDGSVDLHQCAEKIVRGKFMNGGQTCIAPDYVVVRDEIYDDFVKAILTHVVRIEARTEMSSLIDDRHETRLETMLADAVKEGAILHHSELHRSGLTIATGVPLTCKLMQEEIFGPILPVLRYRSEEELIGIVRTNPSPLTMYVFSNDDGLVNRLAAKLKTGSICINETLLHFVHPHLPFGGVGQSGSGRSHGRAGFETFSNPVPIIRQNARRGIIPLVYPSKGRFGDWARELLFRILGR